MWNRFTPEAQRAVYLAQEEAHRLGENEVAPHHLLLGVLQEHSSAVTVLDSMGVDTGRIRAEVARQMNAVEKRSDRDMRLSRSSKRVIDQMYAEASRLDSHSIGTEHLLLGLILDRHGTAGRILSNAGVDLQGAHRAVRVLQANAIHNDQPQAIEAPHKSRIASLAEWLRDFTGKWRR